MANGDLQDALTGAVVDGQSAFDFGDFDVTDDARAGDIHDGVVLLLLFLRQFPLGAVQLCQVGIVGSGLFQHFFVLAVIDLGDTLGIGGDGTGLVERVPVVTDCWVQQ